LINPACQLILFLIFYFKIFGELEFLFYVIFSLSSI
jgi:hypothetical protein